jgi:hypothetical protein
MAAASCRARAGTGENARMAPNIVLPDGDPHMAAVLSRPEFVARFDRRRAISKCFDLVNWSLTSYYLSAYVAINPTFMSKVSH